MLENYKIITSPELNKQTKQQVLDLWNNEYPEKLTYNSLIEFNQYLKNLHNIKHYLLTDQIGLISGWALTFEREQEKWFAIILNEKIQRKGLGQKLIEILKQEESILNAWVIDHNNDKKKNGHNYVSPLKFYEKCGFKIQSESRLELDIISAVKITWTNK